MTTKNEVLDSGNRFRSALFELSQCGNFSGREREGFERLRSAYHMKLEQFFLHARFGNSSPNYNDALAKAEQGNLAAANCVPGNPASQQPTFNAALEGAAALAAASDPLPKPFTIARL